MSVLRLMARSALAVGVMVVATYQLQAQEQTAFIRADSLFIHQAAAGNLLEVRLGELATDKTSNLVVRRFAEKMVSDHKKMLDQWEDVASDADLEFNARLEPNQDAQVDRLEELSKEEFDRAYMGLMIQNHQANVGRFQAESRSYHSTPVRELIISSLPALQEHLRLSQEVGARVGATTVAVGAPQDGPITQDQPARRTPPITQNPPVRTPYPPSNQDQPTTQDQRTAAERDRDDQRGRNIRADAEFIRDVAADNYLEVQLAQLAERKAQDSEVKDYAKRVLRDRAEMGDQWIQLARSGGMGIRPGMGPRHREKLTRLQRLSGREFDRIYMTTEVQSNQDYVEYFQKEGRQARSERVRDLVGRHLPKIRDHVEESQEVAREVGVDVAAALKARHTGAYRN
jgi:putative membrane protein